LAHHIDEHLAAQVSQPHPPSQLEELSVEMRAYVILRGIKAPLPHCFESGLRAVVVEPTPDLAVRNDSAAYPMLAPSGRLSEPAGLRAAGQSGRAVLNAPMLQQAGAQYLACRERALPAARPDKPAALHSPFDDSITRRDGETLVIEPIGLPRTIGSDASPTPLSPPTAR